MDKITGHPTRTGSWFRRGLQALALGLALSVAACGGGGGGGGGSNFSVALDRNSIELNMDYGGSVPFTQVRATGSGTLPATLYASALVEGTGIDPAIIGLFSGSQATFTMQPAPGLRPGVYTGRVLLLACSDVGCVNRIGGTPLAVSYRVTVRAVLRAEPTSLFEVSTGGTAAQGRVRITLPEGASSFSVANLDAAPWLRSRTEGEDLVFDYLPWRSGFYSVSLDIVAGGSRIPLPINYQVVMPPGGERDLAVEPRTLTLNTTEGARSDARRVDVTPASWSGDAQPVASVRYAEGTPTGWLEVLPGGSGVSVRANAATLSQGSYTATLVFTPAAPATAIEVPVALSVGPGLVRPADWPIALFAETGAAALNGQAAVQVAQGANVAWTATSNQPWLRLSTASGTTGSSSVAWTVDTTALAALANFEDHVATVTLRAASSVYTPTSFEVRVEKRLPEVQWVGPATAVTGRTTMLTVRGRGFNAVADPNRLATGATPRGSVSRVSDTELRVQITPGSASTNSISMSNALSLPPAAATLQILAPRSYAYAAVPTAGAKRALVVDAVRQAVYVVNVENESLNRFRFDGGAWVLDAASVPAILDAGLSPDGQQIIVSATPGRIRLLDPATLASSFTLDVPDGLARNLTYVGHGISTTNDGYSWLPTGDTGRNELVRFDHATRTLQARTPQPELSTNFYGGPWTMVSRDGGTMAVVQSGSISPAPPALVWRSGDPLLRLTGAGLSFFYEASWADDGSRILIDGAEVRDANFGLVGTTRVEGLAGGPWVSLLGMLSPEGRRAYVLAYPESAFTAGGPGLPRVFVFDSSAADPASSGLPLLGHFDIAHFPGCRSFFTSDCPTVRPRMAIAPDGQTLFIAGNERFLVVPVPEALRSSGAMAAPRMRARQAGPQVWPWSATGR